MNLLDAVNQQRSDLDQQLAELVNRAAIAGGELPDQDCGRAVELMQRLGITADELVKRYKETVARYRHVVLRAVDAPTMPEAVHPVIDVIQLLARPTLYGSLVDVRFVKLLSQTQEEFAYLVELAREARRLENTKLYFVYSTRSTLPAVDGRGRIEAMPIEQFIAQRIDPDDRFVKVIRRPGQSAEDLEILLKEARGTRTDSQRTPAAGVH
jgi:hypothetical protein